MVGIMVMMEHKLSDFEWAQRFDGFVLFDIKVDFWEQHPKM